MSSLELTADKYIDAGAEISACGKYRYSLWREWRGTHDRKNWRWLGAKDGAGHEIGEPKAAVFVMLNPSTADGKDDDATIRKCVGFAKRWRYERLVVLNLFAYRATDPKVMMRLSHDIDPVGRDNAENFAELVTENYGIIVCAWGAGGKHLGQDETMLGWIGDRPAYALGLTKDGSPRHPLYVPYEAKPFRWDGRI